MAEYGVGLAELEEVWTPGQTLLMLRRIVERYEARNGKTTKREPQEKAPMSTDELLQSDWMSG